jgi:hypothetical protein
MVIIAMVIILDETAQYRNLLDLAKIEVKHFYIDFESKTCHYSNQIRPMVS